MKSIIISYKGQRKNNQDVILAKNLNDTSYLYMIGDGMGGYENGDVAARMVVDSIATYLSTFDNIQQDDIQKGVNKSNLTIRQYQEQNHTKMGTTIGGVIIQNNMAKLFWIGDVKIMYFKRNILKFESKSHNLINEIIENGSISDSDRLSKYAHIVTRSIQGDPKTSIVSYKEIDFNEKEDLIIICSDGVHNIIDSHSIEFLLNQNSNINESVEKIKKRLQSESIDNSSLIAITYN